MAGLSWLDKGGLSQLNEEEGKYGLQIKPAGDWGSGTGFGADSEFANTPSGAEDRGTLTKFGQTGTGTKFSTVNVGSPVKKEPLP